MDIKSLYTVEDHDAGAEMQVKDQHGKEMDCYITIVGIDSKTWRKSFNKHKRKILSDNDENAAADLYAGVSLSWRGFTSKGEELPFSKKSVKALYINAPYLVEQVDTFIADRANFTKS